MVGLLKKTMICLHLDMLLNLYNTLVSPRLEYCIQAWVTYNKVHIRPMEQVEPRATQLVPELPGLMYEHRLTQLGITTLEEHTVTGDMIKSFKILKRFDKIGDGNFIELSPIDRHLETRGHSMKVLKPRHITTTTKRNKFFSSRIVDK